MQSVNLIIEYFPRFLQACLVTLMLTGLSYVLGQLVGLVVALGRVSRNVALKSVCFIYTFCLRGSPLLVQIFIVYYAISQIPAVRESIFWPLLREPFFCAVLAIGLNSSAYVAELLRGAILKVSRGQREAASILGLSTRQQYLHVIIPQAYRSVTPALGNEAVLVLKATSLASVITLMDITGIARTLVADTYAPFELFALAGCFYLAIGYALTLIFRVVERYLAIPGMLARKL